MKLKIEIKIKLDNISIVCIQHTFEARLSQVHFSFPPERPESQHFSNQAKTQHYLKITVKSGFYKHSARFLKGHYLTFCSYLCHSNMFSVNTIPQVIDSSMTREICHVFESEVTVTGLRLDVSKAFDPIWREGLTAVVFP
jgi:hypothetical protein